MSVPRYVGNNYPFAALEALTEVAVHHYGPQHLTRGGSAGRARAVMARGAPPPVAAAVAALQAKGHVGEVHVAASHSLHSGLLGKSCHSRPNTDASHPHEDIHVLRGSLIANNAQVGVGSPKYLARKAMASNANQVVGNCEALAALRKATDPASALIQDHMLHEGTRSAVLTEEKATTSAQVILERLLLQETAVPFAKKIAVSLTSGAKSAGLAVARSLVYQAVDRLHLGIPFDGEMVRNAVRASKDAFVNASLTTCLLTTRFLERASMAFDGRLLQALGGSVVVAGAIADVVVTTAKEVVAWTKNQITFDELLRRAGVHVFSTGSAAVGGAAMLKLASGMPWWGAMLMFAAGAAVGGYAGHKLGEYVLRPSWDMAPTV